MMYEDRNLRNLYLGCSKYYSECHTLIDELLESVPNVGELAAEHLQYGIARRLSILAESLNALFELTPPELAELAEREKINLANAQLHAFLINVSGILDNMAWFIVFQYKRNAISKRKHEVGLFHKKFKPFLPSIIKVKVVEFRDWYEFLVGQRHPIAHRIPPYIIPYIESPAGTRSYTPRYIHSYKDGQVVPLHPQILCDIGAVVELVKALLEDLRVSYV